MDRLTKQSSSQPLHHSGSPSTQQDVNQQQQQRIRPSSSSFSLAFPRSATVQSLMGHASHIKQSRTWTPSSGGLGLLSDADDVQDRSIFVVEYNRLAKKHGVRPLIVEDFAAQQQIDASRSPEKRSWLSRLFRGSSDQQPADKTTAAAAAATTTTKATATSATASSHRPRHRRSVSDLGYLIHNRRELPKIVELQTMVRLSGRSVLYLPQEYSPCSLMLPTCIRATAQFIAQNAMTRGIFRIPGSVRIVNSLFEYYCYMANDGVDIAGTVCCATLPAHIQYSVHDVGSTFKRLLSVLPGGILGSLSLFDAFVGIHSQLHGEPEFPRTKQTRVRARLIALAIGTIESQFRRELICAVLGLLSLIGRVAEVSPREDADGRPLPTGDLIGYNALGIVFGPLLVGELLEKYTMKLATPTSGLILFPLSPKKQRREKHKPKSKAEGNTTEPPPVNKVMVANSIVEMLITNWRDMVRQMKALGTHHRHGSLSMRPNQDRSHSSASGSFVINMPQELKEARSGPTGRDHSPEPETPTLALSRRRSRPGKETGVSWLHRARPPRQKGQAGTRDEEPHLNKAGHDQERVSCGHKGVKPNTYHNEGVCRMPPPMFESNNGALRPELDAAKDFGYCQGILQERDRMCGPAGPSPVPPQKVPPRCSSKRGLDERSLSGSMMRPGSAMSMPVAQSQCVFDIPDQGQRKEKCKRELDPEICMGQARTTSLTPEWIFEDLLCEESEPRQGHKSLRKRSSEPCHLGMNIAGADPGASEDPIHAHHFHVLYEEDEGGERESGRRKWEPKFRNAKLNSVTSLNLSAATSGFRNWPLADHGKDEQSFVEGQSHCHTSMTFPLHNNSHESHTNTNLDNCSNHDNNSVHGYDQGQDTSQNNSVHSNDSQAPSKRRSVRAMAAMFESQQMLQQLTQGYRQPPPGGVEVTPLSKQTRELFERSNSLPNMTPRGSERPAWIEGGVRDLDDLVEDVETMVDRNVDQKGLPTPAQSREHDGAVEQTKPCNSTCARKQLNLEFQLRNLKQLVNDKSEEVEELRRRLETMQNGASPSEQLKQARRETVVWRDKAEAAEKRLRVFEKFTTKVRGIRDSMMGGSSRQSSANHQRLAWMDEEGKDDEDEVRSQYVQRVRFAEMMKQRSEERISDDSGVLGDETVVPARIRNCLHCNGGKGETLVDEEGEMMGSRDMWSAVEELLRMEEDELERSDLTSAPAAKTGAKRSGSGRFCEGQRELID